jgi:hypothetical protein
VLFWAWSACVESSARAGVLDVEALVGGDDALGLLELGEAVLRLLEVGAQQLQLVVEPRRRLLGGLDAQVEIVVSMYALAKPLATRAGELRVRPSCR